MSSVDAFLPLKGASQRVPGKNMRSFAGRPLFHVIIDTLSRAERIGQVYVDTDSDEIAESASAFPEIVIRSRKPDLIGHDVSVNWLLKDFLLDQLEVEVLFYDGRAVGITLPSHVVMEVTECEPGVAGNTSQGATKKIGLESGLSVQAPLFIKLGERVKIDTRTGDYVERVNN